jgi:hypothetical protein
MDEESDYETAHEEDTTNNESAMVFTGNRCFTYYIHIYQRFSNLTRRLWKYGVDDSCFCITITDGESEYHTAEEDTRHDDSTEGDRGKALEPSF